MLETNLKRAVHNVTYRDIQFKGWLYALDPGMWVVSTRTAKRICELHGCQLPRIGYDRMLDDVGRNYVSNWAGSYVLTLRPESYDFERTGKFEHIPGGAR